MRRQRRAQRAWVACVRACVRACVLDGGCVCVRVRARQVGMDGRTAHTPTNQSNVNKTQVDTIDGLVPLVPIALSRLGVASERAALKKDIKASFF